MDNEKVHCNSCMRNTWHSRLYCIRKNDGEDEGYFFEYRLLQCRGCDDVRLSVVNMVFEGDEEEEISSRFYPPKLLRKYPDWFWLFLIQPPGFVIKTSGLWGALNEIYTSVNSECYRVSMMGVRALLEQIMIENIGDKGSFRKNLYEFKVSGFVSDKQEASLSSALEAGHASIHRAYTPDMDEVSAVLSVLENVIESIYIIPLNERMHLSKISKGRENG